MAGTPSCTNHDDRPGVFMWSTWTPPQTAVWCAECLVPGLVEMVAAQIGTDPSGLMAALLGGAPVAGAPEPVSWETYAEAVLNGKTLLATGEITPEQYEEVIRPLFMGLSDDDQDRAIKELELEPSEDEIAAQLAAGDEFVEPDGPPGIHEPADERADDEEPFPEPNTDDEPEVPGDSVDETTPDTAAADAS